MKLSTLAPRLVFALFAIFTVAVLLLAVLPLNTYVEQRGDITDKTTQLEELEAANEELRVEKDALHTDEAVEAIARRDYGLVMPGEEVFAVLPPAPEPVHVPDTWPFSELATQLSN